MSPKQPVPARLHVLLAREAPYGVVIRRGPSKVVCTIGWDRTTDTFELGQWLRGRVAAQRSDLSPDGRLLVYAAHDFRGSRRDSHVWTAVSRTPYLTAIWTCPEFSVMCGGGLFVSDGECWVGGRSVSGEPPAGLELSASCPTAWSGSDPRASLYSRRLQRDGWVCVGEDVFEKEAGAGWRVRKRTQLPAVPSQPGGWEREEYELHQPATDTTIDLPDWEWADVDRDRLVWAAGGKLFAGHVGGNGLEDERELHDFSDMTFEAIEAPY